MIRSMTGYGKSVANIASRLITIEIRAVNSKQLDLNMRLPGVLKEKELELRSLLAPRLERGKIDFSVQFDNVAGVSNYSIDHNLAAHYYRELKSFAEANGIAEADYLSVITRMPEVIKSGSEQIGEDDWKAFIAACSQAVAQFDEFRLQEGKTLESDFSMRIGRILEYLGKTEAFETKRISQIRDRIRKNLREFTENENVDENRFEQELFYYLEKLDITEEKIRLKQHCEYFVQCLADADNNGKKLNFVSQEIGREINTLGSKANDADIQKLVVEMKDELEKIKEQLLNIL
mgnify:CR=1 FL=1